MDERAFLEAIKEKPDDATTRLAYADWLEEHGRAHEALQQRVKAGVSEVRYKVRRKSDGLFSEGGDRVRWSATGKAWRALPVLKSHLSFHARGSFYGGSSWSDVEVVVYEVRVQLVASLPVSLTSTGRSSRLRAVIEDPPGSR